MKLAARFVLTVLVVWSFAALDSSVAKAQTQYRAPEHIDQLSRSLADASGRLDRAGNALFTADESHQSNPFSRFMDRIKPKPGSLTLPRFGLMDKLKSLNPLADRGIGGSGLMSPGEMPFLSGLGKLFQPRQSAGPSFMDRLTGRSKGLFENSTLNQQELAELNNMARRGTETVDRFSQETQRGVMNALNDGNDARFPGPPRRSAQQPSGGATRY